jgi:hypothetical protein
MIERPFYLRISFWVIVIVAAVITYGITKPQQPVQEPLPTERPVRVHTYKPSIDPMVVTAGDLIIAYDKNEVKADITYRDKYLQVTGVIKNIGKDILEQPYITLGRGIDTDIISVQCFFEDEDEITKVAELQSGETITLFGTCDGTAINVIVKDCEIRE